MKREGERTMMTSRLTDNTASLTCRGKRAISLAVALWVALTLLVPMSAHAGTIQVSGTFAVSVTPPLTCTGIVCYVTDYSGSLKGRAEHTLVSIFPTVPAGIVFIVVNTKIRTSSGNLFCVHNGAGNTSGDGEFVELCTGGTGVFAGASGYIQRIGNSQGGPLGQVPGFPPLTASGQYFGKITAPLLGN